MMEELSLTPQLFRDLYKYNFWANRLMWNHALPLSDAQLMNSRDPERDSIFLDCIHIMGVEYWWIHFLATGNLDFVNVDALQTRDAVRMKWDEVEQEVFTYIERLTPDELQREVRPEFWKEGRKPICVWQALFQVANHSTDHRAQILSEVRFLGGTTVEQDYLNFLFERQQQD